MLVVLDPNTCRAITEEMRTYNDKIMIMNLNANIMDPNITNLHLIPMINLTGVSEQNIDSVYIDAILNDDNYFVSLITVMILLRNGYDVYLLSYAADGILGPIIEIILKLIQQRYGYNYQVLNGPEDFDPTQQAGFTTIGIQTLDRDVERYEQIMTILNPNMYINEEINDEHL